MRDRLLSWQFENYPPGHANRVNLLVHLVTVPVFIFGTLLIVSAPWTSLWRVPVGLVNMFFAVIAQGQGHAREKVGAIPFTGPVDVVSRLFVEQWITFPRFVLSGGFARSWRAAGEGR